MAIPNSIWGIDIGQTALKAVKLQEVDGQLQAEALELIEYPKLLSEDPAGAGELIHQAMENLTARNIFTGSRVVVAVPGQSGFTRFVKLPPVEPKKIPDIVRFEAEQQIPFPINDVIWRWQTFTDPNSPDVQVGIFAMKHGDVGEVLGHFDEAQIGVDIVQMGPLSLLNFMVYDGQIAPEGATLLADVGAAKTDLVVADGPRVWTRTIQIGGNDFTEAMAKAFKLSFAKAEKLKRTAATSKYARQIFQAMRPVFVDLAQEIQRSVGYYASMRREARFHRVVGVGNGFRMPGLQKFLEQQLNIPVVRVDSYNRLKAGGSVSPAMLDENVLSFAMAYGLAVQGLDLAQITTNLLPDEIVRKRIWGRKRQWFAAAAVILLAALAMPLYRSYVDRSVLVDNDAYRGVRQTISSLTAIQNQYNQLVNQGPQEEQQIQEYKRLFAYRDWWPSMLQLISQTIETVAPEQKLLSLYSAATTDQQRQQVMAQIKAKPRQERQMIFVDSIEPFYYDNIEGLKAESLLKGGVSAPGYSARPGGQPKRGFFIKLTGRTTLGRQDTVRKLMVPMRPVSEQLATKNGGFSVVDYSHAEVEGRGDGYAARSARTAAEPVTSNPELMMMAIEAASRRSTAGRPGMATTEPAGPKKPDPLLPDEDTINDTSFVVGWLISIDVDGLSSGDLGAGQIR